MVRDTSLIKDINTVSVLLIEVIKILYKIHGRCMWYLSGLSKDTAIALCATTTTTMSALTAKCAECRNQLTHSPAATTTTITLCTTKPLSLACALIPRALQAPPARVPQARAVVTSKREHHKQHDQRTSTNTTASTHKHKHYYYGVRLQHQWTTTNATGTTFPWPSAKGETREGQEE